MIKGTKENFHEVTKHGLTIVDFYSDSCMPCQAYGETLDIIDKLFPEINVVKVDITTEIELTREHKVRSIPYSLFMKDGKVREAVIGSISEEKVLDVINRIK